MAARSTSIEPPESSRIRWRSLLFAIFLLLVFCTVLGYANGVAEGRLVDTDAYSWLNRVTDFHSDGEWFDDTIQRINPTGLKQHWSRPYDVLLLLGGLVGEPFFGFADALFAWAIVIPSLLGVATFCVLWWGFSDLLDEAGVEALALLAALQLAIVQGFMAGRSDHQALIGLLLIAQLAVSRKALGARGTRLKLILAGALSALGLWVGMELIVVVVAIMIAVTSEWLLEGSPIGRLAVYALSLAVFSLVWLVLENGTDGFVQTQLDELSIVFVAFALLAAIASGVLAKVADRLMTRKARALALVVVAGLGGAVLVAAFPDVLGGPLGEVDPLYGRTRLRHISEIQPLIGDSVAESVQKTVPALSLLPFAIYAFAVLRRNKGDLLGQQLHLLLVSAIFYLPLAVGQIRWQFPLNLLLAVPAALAVQQLMRSIAPRAQRVHLGQMAVAAGAALWWVPFLLVPVPDPPARCDINAAVAAVNNQYTVGATPHRLMAFTDHGPELLFRTPHSVYSIPNHRHQPGYTATFEAMTATDLSAAREILQHNSVDLVLTCSDAVETSFYGPSQDSFHARLVAGDAPEWLTKLAVPGGEPGFRLYKVNGRDSNARVNGGFLPALASAGPPPVR